ncbi:MAG: rhodanese-like domain-containing protein [Saprospiraceae bacterium]|nr:rhodanese-like domain-containing protein [Saprospiraceae bacterium]
MKFLIVSTLVFLVACRQAPDQATSLSSTPPAQGIFQEDANYATHPGIDLEVQSFFDRFRRLDKSQAMLLDLRTPPEFDEGYIPGAIMINFLENDIDQQLGMLDKNNTYFLYCAQGARSMKCVDKMKALGFTKLYNLLGGYEAYEKSLIK